MRSFLKVTPLSTNNIFTSGNICFSDVTVPASDKSTGIANSDLHIYVIQVKDTSATYAVSGGWC